MFIEPPILLHIFDSKYFLLQELQVIDIEEMAWAPRYGLKGIIDASVRVNISSSSGSSHETIMPLEFKTGKGTSGQVTVTCH